jgi:hypothetical protein
LLDVPDRNGLTCPVELERRDVAGFCLNRKTDGPGGGWVGGVMARVYVSSTVADLRRERREVMDWLVAADHQVIHSYRPNSATVREGCLEDVAGCDLYVLIAGHRYGFQPEDDNPEGLSITQLARVMPGPGGGVMVRRRGSV